MTALLLLCAEVQQDGGTGREGRHLDASGVLVAGQLLVQDHLVCGCQALATVGARDADAGQAAVEQHALELAVAGDRGPFGLFVATESLPPQLLQGDLPKGGPDVRPGPVPKALEILDVLGAWRLLGGDRAHAATASRASSRAAIRWRWSAGVPITARSTVRRRRNRWRSCSNVTPIPPCICTQSCTSSAP